MKYIREKTRQRISSYALAKVTAKSAKQPAEVSTVSTQVVIFAPFVISAPFVIFAPFVITAPFVISAPFVIFAPFAPIHNIDTVRR